MKSTEMDREPPQNPMRRRLARGGIAGTVVLGSLISKPVLGAVPYHCTISGQISGNLSRPDDNTNCKTLGRSPGYWGNKPRVTWPAPYIRGELADNAPTCDNYQPGTLFSEYFVDSFWVKVQDGACKTVETDFDKIRSATMLEVLDLGGGLNASMKAALGRAAVASLLNAAYFKVDYPLTEAAVIKMFNDCINSGQFQLPNGAFWTPDQVKGYFESLYGNL